VVEDVETDFRERLQSTLTGAYRIERELGGGGMSRVFVAEERALSRRVVVKVLSPHLAAGVDFERFKQEILLTAQLQHPHILPVFTTGETEGLPYYTMPFVEGESLRVHLMRAGAMPIAAAVSILRDVARALEFAHGKGVVHRDIKPDNILLAGNTPTVADFGIARAGRPETAQRSTPEEIEDDRGGSGSVHPIRDRAKVRLTGGSGTRGARRCRCRCSDR
jgi:serine/threonine-protein kinase